jgi:hypothetical protein
MRTFLCSAKQLCFSHRILHTGASIPFPPFGDVVRGVRKLLALFSAGAALFSALFSCSPSAEHPFSVSFLFWIWTR